MIISLKQLYFRIMGLSIIGLFIYFRFIIERLPKDLNLFNNDTINYSIFFIIVLFFLSGLYGFYINIKILLNKNNFNNIFIKIINKVIYTIKSYVTSIYDWIIQTIPDSLYKLTYLIKLFYDYMGHKERLLFILFQIVPYMMVALMLSIDVLVFFKLNFFYKTLPLLALPLLFNVWKYIMQECINAIETKLIAVVNIEHSFEKDGRDKFRFSKKTDTTQDVLLKCFQKDVPAYLELYPIRGFIEIYNKFTTKYHPRIQILFYSTYILNCIYIIYININVLTIY